MQAECAGDLTAAVAGRDEEEAPPAGRRCSSTQHAGTGPVPSRPNKKPRGLGDGLPVSEFVGVCWDKMSGRWKAQITHEKQTHRLGHFDEDGEEAAARAFDAAARRLRGAQAHGGRAATGPPWRLNFPTDAEQLQSASQVAAAAKQEAAAVKAKQERAAVKKQKAEAARAAAKKQAELELEQAAAAAAAKVEAERAAEAAAKAEPTPVGAPTDSVAPTTCPPPKKKPRGLGDELPISRFFGVSWNERNGKWKAQIKYGGRQLVLGNFEKDNEEAAARERDTAARRLRGSQAHSDGAGSSSGPKWRLNFPTDAEQLQLAADRTPRPNKRSFAHRTEAEPSPAAAVVTKPAKLGQRASFARQFFADLVKGDVLAYRDTVTVLEDDGQENSVWRPQHQLQNGWYLAKPPSDIHGLMQQPLKGVPKCLWSGQSGKEKRDKHLLVRDISPCLRSADSTYEDYAKRAKVFTYDPLIDTRHSRDMAFAGTVLVIVHDRRGYTRNPGAGRHEGTQALHAVDGGSYKSRLNFPTDVETFSSAALGLVSTDSVSSHPHQTSSGLGEERQYALPTPASADPVPANFPTETPPAAAGWRL